MNEPLDPIQRVPPERRLQARRDSDWDSARKNASAQREEDPCESANLPVVVAAPPAPQPDPRDGFDGSAAFAAQVLGQPGQRRGLRGGPETLEKARAAYLEAEYSGPADRRIARGVVTRTDI